MARSENIPGIHYLGALTRADMNTVLSNAIASVLPSRVDNLPNTAIESLSLGTPVITMANSSIDELVTDGITGWVVPQGDIDALANAMQVAWNKGALVNRSSLIIGNKVFDEMNPDMAINNLLHFAENCLK